MKMSFGASGSATDVSSAAPLPVVVPGAVAVTGTFYQATQPVSFAWAGLTDAQLRASLVAVRSTPAAGTLTDRSGTIATGGTAQQLMTSNAARLGFSVQNLSSGDLWINPLSTAAASQPSLKLLPGAYFESPAGYGATGAISIFGATTSQAFSAKEW
jgi:hypothetical protein